MKYLLTAAIIALSTTVAQAKCVTPELEFSVDQSERSGSEFSITFNIPLGRVVDRLCSAEIANATNESLTEFHKSRVEEQKALVEEAKARKQHADALEQEQDNLEQKIEICGEFTYDEAPNSIRKFCGDLLK